MLRYIVGSMARITKGKIESTRPTHFGRGNSKLQELPNLRGYFEFFEAKLKSGTTVTLDSGIVNNFSSWCS